jgi:outer membrane protein assembly factor BamB
MQTSGLPSKPTHKVEVAPPGTLLHAPVPVENGVIVSSWSAEVLCVDWGDLQPSWRQESDRAAAVAAFGDAVILDSFSRSPRRYHAVHRETGKTLWDFRGDEAQTDRRWNLEKDGRLLSCGRFEIAQADPHTGQLTRRWEVPDSPFQRQWVGSDIVILGSGETIDSDPMRAYDLLTGRVLWSRRLNEELLPQARSLDPQLPFFVGFAGSDGRAVFAAGKTLFGFAVREQRQLWKRDFNLAASRSPVLHRGRVYFLAFALDDAPRDEVRLVCLDEGTGETLYERPLAAFGPEFARRIQSWPGVIHDGFIVFTQQDHGLLMMFDLASGDLVWSYKYRAEIYEPVLTARGLIAGADDGNLLIFERQST